jgi:hypothetical protein
LQAVEKYADDASTKRPPDEGAVSLNGTEVLSDADSLLNTRLRVTRDISSFFINRLSVSVILQSFSESQVPAAGKQCGVLARDLT